MLLEVGLQERLGAFLGLRRESAAAAVERADFVATPPVEGLDLVRPSAFCLPLPLISLGAQDFALVALHLRQWRTPGSRGFPSRRRGLQGPSLGFQLDVGSVA